MSNSLNIAYFSNGPEKLSILKNLVYSEFPCAHVWSIHRSSVITWENELPDIVIIPEETDATLDTISSLMKLKPDIQFLYLNERILNPNRESELLSSGDPIGYTIKPVSSIDVRREQHCAVNFNRRKDFLYVKTFGEIELYKNNVPTRLSCREKELFAYLFMKNGLGVNYKELQNYLIDGCKDHSYMSWLIHQLEKRLETHHLEHLLCRKEDSSIGLNMSLLHSDYEDWLTGKILLPPFGRFLSTYYWANDIRKEIEELRRQKLLLWSNSEVCSSPEAPLWIPDGFPYSS